MLAQTCLAYTRSHICCRKLRTSRARSRTTRTMALKKKTFNISRVSRSLVRDDSRFSALCFSVCYSMTNVLSPLQTLVLPDRALPSRTRFRACVEFCASELSTHARNLREQILLSNFCCRKFRQQMSDGAYTRSEFPTTSSHQTFVVGNSERVYAA